MVGWILMAIAGAAIFVLGILIVVHRERVSRWQRSMSVRNRNDTPRSMAIVGLVFMIIGLGWLLNGVWRAVGS